MTRGIKGKIAVVTGAGHGIGRSIAQRYADDGAAVLVADIDVNSAKDTARSIGDAGGSAASFGCDVRDPDAVRAMFDAAEQELGAIDIVVNNAGIAEPRRIVDETPEHWDAVFAVNVRGVFLGVQEAARRMAPRGSGCIINMASAAGRVGRAFFSSYSASKHAVIGITRCAALELAPYHIRVNALCPGIVDTDMWRRMNQTFSELEGLRGTTTWDERVASIPLGRAETAEDVANAAAMLASDDASYMTGQSLSVDGGIVMI